MGKKKLNNKSQSTKQYTSVIGVPQTRTGQLKFGDITPQQLSRAIMAALGGQPGMFYATLKRFYKIDGHLSGDLQRRISAASAKKPSLLALEDNKEAGIAVEAIEEIFKKIKYPLLSRSLLLANYYGTRAVELEWGPFDFNGKTLFAPIGFKLLPGDFTFAKKVNKEDKFTTLFVGGQPLADYPKGKILFLSHEPFTAYENISFLDQGVGFACSKFSVYKYYNYADHAAFNEAYGIPFRIAYYDDSIVGVKLKDLESTVHDAGNAASMLIPDGAKLEFPDINHASSVDAFEKMKEACNREISSAILSQSITSSSGKHGTYGTSVTANGISLEVATSDAYQFDLVLQDVIDTILEYNFPSAGKIAIYTPVKKAEDPNKLVLVSKTLQEMGINQSISHLRRTFDSPAPEDNDDVLPGKTSGSNSLLP